MAKTSTSFKPGNKYGIGHRKVPSIYTEEWLINEAQLLKEWMNREDSIYLKSFAIEQGYSPQRLTEFAEKSAVFSEVYKEAKEWQEQKLINLSLWNKTNFQMTRVILAKQHDWVEKQKLVKDENGSVSMLLSMVDGDSKELVKPE